MPGSEREGQRESFARGADHLPAAAGRLARDRDRARASEAAIESEVIEFQLARQRVELRSVEELAPLSPREQEVLELVADGRADGDIAERLFISKKTASVHVANIKGKLGASSRVEIAMLATRLGLVDATRPTATSEAQSRLGRMRVVCPFKGLASYDIADAGFFFGRERSVAELVARLAGSSFVGVVGPSGTGKSSIVRAGLVPALADGVLPGSDRWAVALTRPGITPSADLTRVATAAIRRQGHDPGDSDLAGLLDALPMGTRLLVVIDQFEELFTVCSDEAEREAFVRAITSLALDPGARAVVVVAVRADFYGRCAGYRDLAELLGPNHLLVGPMTPDELSRAIEFPARAAGLRVEPELTAALVNDMRDEPGALPLLSAALLDLWQRRDGRTIRLEAYARLGGVSASVSRLAEAAVDRLADRLPVARTIFLRLATRAENGLHVRRPVALSALDGDRNPEIAGVLAVLTEQRLVTIDEGTVEIAHEVLLRAWPRLRRWLEEDAEEGRVREHVGRAAADWTATGEDPGELYRGARLSATLEWASEHEPELNEVERRFLAASRVAAEHEIERQRRMNRRLRWLLVGAVALAVLALGAGIFAATQQVRAERQSEIADARAQAASAVAALGSDPGLAKLLTLTAAQTDPSIETLAVLHEALAADAVVDRYRWPPEQTVGQLWTDVDRTGGLIVASGTFFGPSDHLEVVDRSTDAVLWSYPPAGTPVAVGPAFFSPDGRLVVAGVASRGGAARPPAGAIGAFVWDARTGRLVRRVDLGRCGGFAADVSDERLLAAVQEPVPDGDPCSTLDPDTINAPADTSLLIVDLTSGEADVISDRAAIIDLEGPGALSANGRYAAFDERSGDQPGLVVVDLLTERRIVEIPADEALGWVRGLSEDGSLLLLGDRPLTVVDVRDGGRIPLAEYDGHDGESYFAGFGPSGATVYSTGRDGTLRIWDGRTGEEQAAFRGIGGGRPAASPEGGVVLVADPESRTATVVDTRPRGEVGIVETCEARFVAATSLQVENGIALFNETCDDDPAFNGVTQAIDVAARSVRYSLPGFEGQTLAIAPDGTTFVRQEYTAPLVGPLAIRDLGTGELVRELEGLCTWDFERAISVPRKESGACAAFPTPPFPIHILSVQWSPDGTMIAATDHHDADGFVAVWRAADGALIYRGPEHAAESVFDAIFTPDSRSLVLSYFGSGRLQALSTDTWQEIATALPETPLDSGNGRLGLVGFTSEPASLIAVGGYLGSDAGGSLHWLDPVTLRALRAPLGDAHDGSPKSAALSADGTKLATGASDGVVRVWDAASGALAHEIRLADSQIQGVAFTAADELAVLVETGTLLIHTIDSGDLIATVRASLTRAFTAQECARYRVDPCPTLEELSGH